MTKKGLAARALLRFRRLPSSCQHSDISHPFDRPKLARILGLSFDYRMESSTAIALCASKVFQSASWPFAPTILPPSLDFLNPHAQDTAVLDFHFRDTRLAAATRTRDAAGAHDEIRWTGIFAGQDFRHVRVPVNAHVRQ